MDFLIERITERGAKKTNLDLPPILDYNPVFAASFLSIPDSEHYFNLLLSTYENLQQPSQKNIALEELILANEANYNWFLEFTMALNNVENEGNEIYIPLKEICNFRNDTEELIFLPPLIYKYKKVTPTKLRAKDNDIVSLYRILYLRQRYALDDFRGGFPVWYTLAEQIIYENYNAKTNKRVKVEFANGSFHYFIAGASDKWSRIIDVPKEMDHIISAFLFRH